ncbi:hypothetical protein KVV02_007106 [Mortierella alpina]|uniref:Uncharacterized protein n=1 Tax=Mortierella alpina TaxID=64518 RepID=A0A9P8D2K7_MORAP|nr:hypothetical protein KVV02_007106 [Mortierella alpina]
MDSLSLDLDPMSGPPSGGGGRKPPALRNLQPRAPAALDFNDDSDEDEGLLSADYKAQRKTTQDLVDFFKSAPPPSPPRPIMTPAVEEEKKKRSLLQRLRPKKSGGSLSNGTNNGMHNYNNNSTSSINLGNGNRRSSVLMAGAGGTSSNISTMSGMTTTGKGKNGEEITTATLPNGKKYIMIAVDYKDGEKAPGAGTGTGSAMAALASSASSLHAAVSSSSGGRVHGTSPGSVSQRQSRLPDGFENDSGVDKRRSIVLQAGGGEGSKFVLDSSPFLLDSFALDTNFITAPSSSSEKGGSAAAVATNGKPASTSNDPHSNSSSNNKVAIVQPTVDAVVVDEALAQRLASHKAKNGEGGSTSAGEDGLTMVSSSSLDSGSVATSQDFEITLPRPVSRKKVRHVQIQTQHCIMRPMHTQTDVSSDSLVQDLEVKDWSSQTSSGGSSTEVTSSVTSSSTTLSKNGKVANLVASLNSAATSPTTATAPTTFSDSAIASATATATSTDADAATANEDGTAPVADNNSDSVLQLQKEVAQLRQHNTQLQSQVVTLQRDLAAETRARTRTAVAMQDTRDKFEMLSAMAYKKLKEMIFQRHVLEMEVRELRAQVDLNSEVNVVQEGEMLFRQEQLLQQQQQQQQQAQMNM